MIVCGFSRRGDSAGEGVGLIAVACGGCSTAHFCAAQRHLVKSAGTDSPSI